MPSSASSRPAEPRARLSFADRSLARRTGLPQPGPYVVETIRIPARDGVEFGADLYTPVAPSKGVLLARGPYGRGATMARMSASVYAAQGYTVLFVSSRGTADSGGSFDPMRTEVEDGEDVIAWLRLQDWYPGRFATVGGSYLGHTQWAVLADPPPDLVAAVVQVGPHDFSRHAWGTGTFNLDFIGWSEQVGLMANRSMIRAIAGMATAGRRLKPVLEATPMADAATDYFGDRAPWMRDRLERDDIADPYWAPMQHGAALERVGVPILLLGGWQDIFLRQTVEQYRALRGRGVDVALTIGPWTHTQLGGDAAKKGTPEAIEWLDRHVSGAPSTSRATRVHVFDKGAGSWLELEDWPAPTAPRALHLTPDGRLADEAPGADASTRSFRYDPADPTPTVGGPIIMGGGYVDDSPYAKRVDTLVYTGEPLAADLTVMGTPVLTLAHGSEHPDSDLFVRLSDVGPKGRSHNVTEGYLRVREPAADGTVTLDLLDTAYTFRAGHRVRIVVAGGSFPQFARSAGTGENPLVAVTLVPNTHTVAHGGGASVLRLPVAPRVTRAAQPRVTSNSSPST